MLPHKKLHRPTHAPHKLSQLIFWRHIQTSSPINTSASLRSSEIKLIQFIIGALLSHIRAVDPFIYPELNKISFTQSTPTFMTLTKSNQILNYIAWYPNATICFYARNKIFNVGSDVVLLRSHSRLASHFFLNSTHSPNQLVLPIGPILIGCKQSDMLLLV